MLKKVSRENSSEFINILYITGFYEIQNTEIYFLENFIFRLVSLLLQVNDM